VERESINRRPGKRRSREKNVGNEGKGENYITGKEEELRGEELHLKEKEVVPVGVASPLSKPNEL